MKVKLKDYLNQVTGTGDSSNINTSNYVPDPRYANSVGNYYAGGSMVSPTGVPTSVPIPTNNINTNSNTTDTKQNLMNIYQAQIAQSNINQKAELAAINEKANSYTNAYLKSLGLEGTAAGANAIANNNLNLMNAYNQINANEEQALKEAQEQESENYDNKYYELYEALVSNPDLSKREINEALSNYDPNMSTQEYLKLLTDVSGIEDWEDERDNTISQIENFMTELENRNANIPLDFTNFKNIITKLKNAKTKKEYDSVVASINK